MHGCQCPRTCETKRAALRRAARWRMTRCASEVEMQCHLNLARAADGVFCDAQTRGAVIEAVVSPGVGLAVVGRRRLYGSVGAAADSIGHVIERLVLVYVVLWNVETRGVGEVVDVEVVAQCELVVNG